MPRGRKKEVRPKPPLEQLRIRFDKLYLPAMCYLLESKKGDKKKNKWAFEYLRSENSMSTPYPLLPTVSARLGRLREAVNFQSNLRVLEKSLKASVKKLSELLQLLMSELRVVPANEQSDRYSVWLHYKNYDHLFGGLVRSLKMLETGEVEEDEPIETYKGLAYAIRDLVQVSDKYYQKRAAKKAAQKRLGSDSAKVTPSKKDWWEVLKEVQERSYKAIILLDKLLEKRGANYRLVPSAADSLSKPIRRQYAKGLPPVGVFGFLFEPFIDCLCSPRPFFILSACEFEDCGRIYIRKAKDHRGRYCDEHCRKDAYKAQKAS